MNMRRFRRRSRPQTWMAVLHLTELPPGFSMDGDVVNAIHYSLALRGPSHRVSFHGISVGGHRIRLVFTASNGGGDGLVRAVTADMVGYIEARFGGAPSEVEVEPLIALPNAQTQAEALVRIAIEGGLGV